MPIGYGCPCQSSELKNVLLIYRLFLTFGLFWLFFSLGTLVYSFVAFGIENASGIHTRSW